MRLSGCDRPLHWDASVHHTGHSGNRIVYLQGNYDVSYVSLKCHDFVMTIDVIKQILPYNSATVRLIN